jgi:hypothetical protein
MNNEEQVKISDIIQKRANLIGNFIGHQKEREFKDITKVRYEFLGSHVEDYIRVIIFIDDKVVAVSSNLLGIEHLYGFQQHLAQRFFDFAFSQYMELLEVEHGTQFDINIER